MNDENGGLVLSASDLIDFLECEHLTRLEIERTRGALDAEPVRPATGDLLARKGQQHEQAHLSSLIERGLDVVEIPESGSWDARAAATLDAMRAGADVVYQGVLLGDRWRGIADFVERVDGSSGLGDWSYELTDTKLARRVKPYYLVQLCLYSELLAAAQGVPPERIHVVLGTRERASFRLAEFAAYFRRVRERFARFIAERPDTTYPHFVDHCSICRWTELCDAKRVDDDYLGLVAWMRRDQIGRFNENGVRTVAELAVAGDGARPVRMQESTFERLRRQASLQVHERDRGEQRYELLAPEEGRGFARLPEAAEGDLYFDMEGDPFFDQGLEYLFGVTQVVAGEPRFRAFWGTDRAGEKRAFEQFVDFVIDHLERHPGAHVYHYAPYEANALKKLMGLHATREDEVDQLLRRDALVDLYAVVRSGMQISKPSYSIKKVEHFYMEEREAGVTEGEDSIVQFERWLDTGDDSILRAIEEYNEEDCRSTWLLHGWLLERRLEAERAFGVEIPWRAAPEERERGEEAVAGDEELARLRGALLARVPEDADDRSEDQSALWLLAQLLDYHRREAKPAWWEYFDRLEKSMEELIEVDPEAIGGLAEDPASRPEPDGQSLVHTLTFPVQEHRVSPGDSVNPATKGRVHVVDVDDASGRLRIRRAADREGDPLPRALVPGGPYDTREQRRALRRFGAGVAERGLDAAGGRYPALRDILLGRPASPPLLPGSPTVDGIAALAEGLDGSYVFIQGPPGSGKTWTAGQLIVRLIASGKRVGVASTSHKAIHNLLREVDECARAAGVAFRGMKKSGARNPESVYESEFVLSSHDNADFPPPDDVQLVAGTAWLWAREAMDQSCDFLFVDEAGQVSLADALAIGTAARNVVLLGDPLQLAQVSQAVHPAGSGVSVLEHLLGDDGTIPPERGIFLDRTRRMHPDVCAFVSEVVYEGRLTSIEGCERQSIASNGLSGTGVRYIPVPHRDNTRRAPEEVEAIAAEIERLDGGTYALASGETRELGLGDIMVVAPYNAQVRCLREGLPEGVRIGTVDKFQGQEAALVFFSMATSSGDFVPRNIEFLFSRNRLNVAVSRARCMAVLVASPALLYTRCRTAAQMQLVNALCRLAEIAP